MPACRGVDAATGTAAEVADKEGSFREGVLEGGDDPSEVEAGRGGIDGVTADARVKGWRGDNNGE